MNRRKRISRFRYLFDRDFLRPLCFQSRSATISFFPFAASMADLILTIPDEFEHLHLLYELDLSNRFVGPFPEVVLSLPSLRYLDLRFNDLEGFIPPALFDRPLDTIFLNSDRLRNPIPANLGNSPASVIVLAHNRLGGCIPPSIGNMVDTLNEIILLDDNLTGCIPPSSSRSLLAQGLSPSPMASPPARTK